MSAPAPTCRVFIAISPPEPVMDAIERVQKELRQGLPGDGVRWTKRGQLHLTLRFLGDVAPDRLEGLTRSVRHACGGFGALALNVGPLGFFPPVGNPRVIWVRVRDGQERLPLLQRAVERATADFTSEAPEAVFTGHITVGRCKRITGPQARALATLATLATAMENTSVGHWRADRVAIIRSELAPAGSRYTTLAAVPL